MPFIAYWKNTIKANTTNNYVGAFWDVVPTVSALADGKTPNGIDGISFLPTLLGKKNQPAHENLYWEFYEQGFKQALRKGDWKAVRFYKNGRPDHTKLYNLKEDLGEEHNLAPTMPKLVGTLEAMMGKEHIISENPLFKLARHKVNAE
ncbi:MAG: sulfatase/phosphatase domain-containing protein [Chitinophagaceae bacterium]